MTDSAGKVELKQDYLPFGADLPQIGQREVENDLAEGYKYTGQKEEISIGLYYYGARYYDPGTGRFITQDSYPGTMARPQSQNLYLYVQNNPLKYLDPTGHFMQQSSYQNRPDDDPYPKDRYKPTWTPPDHDGKHKHKSQSSGSNDNINLEIEPDLSPYLDLNLDHSADDSYGDILAGIDYKLYNDLKENNAEIEGSLDINAELNKYYGIEHLDVEENEIKMYSPLYNITKVHLVGDIEKNAAFIIPVGKTYQTRLFVTIKEEDDLTDVIVSDYLKIGKQSNMLIGRRINLYSQNNIGGIQLPEKLEAFRTKRFAWDGFNNAGFHSEYEEPVVFRVPKGTKISRVELVHNILFTDALLYGYRQNKINIHVPDIQK